MGLVLHGIWNLPDQGLNLCLLHWQAHFFFTTELPSNPYLLIVLKVKLDSHTVFFIDHCPFASFHGGSVVKESACQCRWPRFDLWVEKIPWRRKWQPTPVTLLRKPHGQRSFATSSHLKSDSWESQSLGRLIRNPGVPKERGVWNSQGGRKDRLFSPLHSLGLYNNNVSCLRTVSGKNLLANPVILKCKLWEWV